MYIYINCHKKHNKGKSCVAHRITEKTLGKCFPNLLKIICLDEVM